MLESMGINNGCWNWLHKPSLRTLSCLLAQGMDNGTMGKEFLHKFYCWCNQWKLLSCHVKRYTHFSCFDEKLLQALSDAFRLVAGRNSEGEEVTRDLSIAKKISHLEKDQTLNSSSFQQFFSENEVHGATDFECYNDDGSRRAPD